MSLRAYQLGRRQQAVDQTRTRIVTATREILGAEDDFVGFSIDAVARQAGVARMTIYYQFGSRVGLLDALCDSLAATGGMWSLRAALDDPDPLHGLDVFVTAFARFWGSTRRVTRRLHALAALDADFEEVIRLRQERRQHHLERLLPRIAALHGRPLPNELDDAVDMLFTLISFETFDSLAGPAQTFDQVAPLVHRMSLASLGLPHPGPVSQGSA